MCVRHFTSINDVLNKKWICKCQQWTNQTVCRWPIFWDWLIASNQSYKCPRLSQSMSLHCTRTIINWGVLHVVCRSKLPIPKYAAEQESQERGKKWEERGENTAQHKKSGKESKICCVLNAFKARRVLWRADAMLARHETKPDNSCCCAAAASLQLPSTPTHSRLKLRFKCSHQTIGTAGHVGRRHWSESLDQMQCDYFNISHSMPCLASIYTASRFPTPVSVV